ncbi:MSC_0619 family F1-like ATPase alpha subunit [Mycoplasmopsis agassizii]|uniref:MSC_0619 family F1-like ATPase alpha subunit n=1 Tax=Mycoplasmopsis agassizii TaxID=33922 RepID=UPI003527E837
MKLKIKSIKDYIVKIGGEFKYSYGQIFHLGEEKVEGMLIRADEDEAFLLVDKNGIEKVKAGDSVELHLSEFQVKTSRGFYHKIIDIRGKTIYTSRRSDPERDKSFYPASSTIFNIASNMMEREPLDQPLETGIFAIDVLIPIGLGQREVIIGDAKSGKTSLALTTILNQKDNDIRVIYVAIGTKLTDLKTIYNTLAKNNMMRKVIILYAPSDNSYEQYLLPYVAMTHAENIRATGKDVLIIFDDLTSHANFLREAALLINKPVGKEAFPGDLFYSHSSLLERAGKFKTPGTITALPIVKILNNDVTSLLSTNVISIVDGQIVLNSDMQASGIMPAVDINRSVSRTGSKVQSKVLAKISSKILRIYTHYQHNNRFAGTNYDFSDAIKEIISKGKALFGVLKQEEYVTYSRAFILILAYIIDWQILENLSDTSQRVRFIRYVLYNTFTGNALMEGVSSAKTEIDEELLKAYISNLMIEFDKLKDDNYEVNFNANSLPIIPEDYQKIKDIVWTDK